jgi:hypothetical protein
VPDPHLGPHRSSGLVDVLDRILDKGLVVAGDVRISLAEVELLTIRIRLIVCSIDKAQAIGLDWWRNDRYFGSRGGDGALPGVGATTTSPRPMTRRRSAARPGRPGRTSDGQRRRRGGE